MSWPRPPSELRARPTGAAPRAQIVRLALAGVLGVAAALLVACAGSSDKLIPVADSGPLQADFETVASDAESADGNCSATAAALTKTQQDFDALPASLDAGLRDTLRQGIANLRARALALCAQPLPQTTPTSTTSKPSTSTSTTTSTTATTPATTPTATTPTSSTPSTTPTNTTPVGGTPAGPSEASPGTGGAQGGTGAGESSGEGAGGAGANQGAGAGAGAGAGGQEGGK